MNIEHEIIKLIGQLKKETDPEKKKKIKQKLKQLYKQLNRVRQGKKDMKVEFKLPIKKDVEELLSGQREDVNKIRNKLSAMKKGVDLSIKKLEDKLVGLSGSDRQKALFEIEKQKIIGRLIEISIQRGDKLITKHMEELMKEVGDLKFGNKELLVELLLTFADDNEFQKEDIRTIMGDLIEYSGFEFEDIYDEASEREPDMFVQDVEQYGDENPFSKISRELQQEMKEEEEGDEEESQSSSSGSSSHSRPLIPSEVSQIREQLEAKSATQKQLLPVLSETEEWFKQWTSPSDIEEFQQLSKAIAKAEKEIAKQEKAQALSESQKQAIYEAYVGFGKRKKMKGGAGISDYLSVLGNMPGLSQMAGMVPIIGPMLGPAIGLAQTGSNIASQGMKEAGLGPGEQVKGLFGTIGKLFGFGKNKQLSPMGKEFLKLHASGGALHPFYKKHKSKLNKAGIHSLQSLKALKGSGFLSDIMGTIGGITPHLSSLLGFIPGAGPILQMGNSAIGSATRVGEDIFKKIGLGKKRGGHKMLPNPFTPDGLYPENEMNDGMAYIQPYYGSGNLPNGGNVSEEFEDQLNQQIVQLLKNRYLDEIRNTDAFNAQLAAKTNTEQQSAVFQLLYAKLLKDAAQEEERRRDAQLLQQ
jgi:hypothetical protein